MLTALTVRKFCTTGSEWIVFSISFCEDSRSQTIPTWPDRSLLADYRNDSNFPRIINSRFALLLRENGNVLYLSEIFRHQV
jgi:hypothetical protein